MDGIAVRRTAARKIIDNKAVWQRMCVALGAGALVATALVAIPAQAGAARPGGPGPASGPSGADVRIDVDVRRPTTAAARSTVQRRLAQAAAGTDARALRGRLGTQGVLDLDAMTRTPRQVSRLDGYLTGPSRAKASDVALGFVRSHPGVFRLSAADLSGLRQTRDYVDIAGIHHLSWVQTAGGLDLFGNGLKANVARDGRLVSMQGAPVGGLRAPASPAAPRLTGESSAVAAAKRDLRERKISMRKGDVARQVLFQTPGGTRRAWRTITMGADHPAVHVLDAGTGRLLYRASLSADLTAPGSAASGAKRAPATGRVFAYYPGAPSGGTPARVNLTAPGWLPAGSPILFGNNVHTYTDVNDDNSPQFTEEVAPGATTSFEFNQTAFTLTGQPCDVWVCTWDPSLALSWQTNRQQAAVQNFYYDNVFHDHLAAAPIGFTEAAGNFQQVNRTGAGKGGDPVLDEPLDGAATASGLPDFLHANNANMTIPPDGMAPRMQMYLFHRPGTTFPAQDPFIAVNGADDAEIVYHEYTHGLSTRLVVGPDGFSTLDTLQSGALGEAWSDWYAADLLANQGHVRDTAVPGDVTVGAYVAAGANVIRTQPLDCPVGTTSSVCPGSPTAGAGGYTYGDFGTVLPFPEPHADGEIWAETLWDLRAALGSRRTESLVTRAMELSPASPSFLDMRNSILQADLVINGGSHAKTLWRVFARRGMGYFAATLDGNDTKPVENFSIPPAGLPTARLTGTITDERTGAPLSGAAVVFGGHASGFAGDLAAVTDAAGRYEITRLFPGSYPDFAVTSAGYLPLVRTQVIRAGVSDASFGLVRDWAAATGGGAITETNGDEFAFIGCGAAKVIDGSQDSGWSARLPVAGADKHVVIKLPVGVDVSAVQIDPSGACGDDGSASTGDYRLETSVDGATWTPAASGHFTPAGDGQLTSVPLAAGSTSGVRYLRYSMLGSQVADVGASCSPVPTAPGCVFVDTSEVVVLGSPAAG
jgi:extracellular elastinolytic metalloproteinase